MKIRSLIVSSLLALGLSLGLSTPSMAGGTHYSVTLHGGDHGYASPKHHRHWRRHHMDDHHYCDHKSHKRHKRHYGRLGHYSRDHYRDSYSGHRKHKDHHDDGGHGRHRG